MRVNIDDFDFYLDEPVGKENKMWIKDKSGNRYLFKEAQIREDKTKVYNDISECIAADIAKLLGLPTADYYLCTFNGKEGVITPDFLNNDSNKKKEELFDGTFLIFLVDPEFNNMSLINKKTYQYYTVSLLLESVERFGITTDAINMLVYDALIANKDRNPSNYGIIVNHETSKIRFAPLFDNGTSLGITLNQKHFNSFFKTENQNLSIVDNNRLNLYLHSYIRSKVTIDRHFHFKEIVEWKKKQTDMVSLLIEQEKQKLTILLKEEKITTNQYHKLLYNIGKNYTGYDISTVSYQPLIEYLATFYLESIGDIINKISCVITKDNLDKLLKPYEELLPISNLNFAKQLILERASWIVNYYYNCINTDRRNKK